MNQKDIIKGVLAGICISFGGTIYLRVGGVAGAVLFAFGLIAVITSGLNRFTGKSQFVWGRGGRYGWLLAMLLWNIVGCLALALAINTPATCGAAEGILDIRFASGPLRCGLLSVGCGFIMTLAVQNAVKGHWLPLLFGIPAFILCGLPHCVADAFYICCLSPGYISAHWADLLAFYPSIVLGNYLGCNAYRLTASS